MLSLSAQADLADTIERIRNGIVAVGTYQPSRQPAAIFLGTGFAVADGNHIVTNVHVLPDSLDAKRKEVLTIFIGEGNSVESRPAQIVDLDTEHDLALLHIVGPALPPLHLGDSQRVRSGQEIAFIGFPIGVVLGLYPATHRGIIAAITPIAVPSVSSRQLDANTIRRLRNPYRVFQLDATAYPGNSGSPLFEPDTGRVIGVINMVFVKESKENLLERPSGITYAIASQFVAQLLRNAGLSGR